LRKYEEKIMIFINSSIEKFDKDNFSEKYNAFKEFLNNEIEFAENYFPKIEFASLIKVLEFYLRINIRELKIIANEIK
jgi:hypothetical protein